MGRQLAAATLSDGTEISYKYNADGIRTEKKVGNTTTSYTLIGSKITGQTDGTNTFYFRYDENDNLVGFELGSNQFFYITNLVGDIIAIVDNQGAAVVEYTYDPWGKCTIVSDTSNCNLGTLNPFRYRGYYYDEDTGLYYLQSRYYDCNTCKFINADDPNILLADPYNVQSVYLYDYCEFNPVATIDVEGKKSNNDFLDYLKKQLSIYIREFIQIYNNKFLSKIQKDVYKNAISGFASSYLRNKNYLLSKEMFSHALYGNGKPLQGNALRLLKTRLRTSNKINNVIKQQIQKANKQNKRVFSIKFDGKQNKLLEFTYKQDPDLYYSIQHTNCLINGDKDANTQKWTIIIKIKDIYDFTDFSRTIRDGISIGNLANDLGVIMQDAKMLIPYDVIVTHSFKVS